VTVVVLTRPAGDNETLRAALAGRGLEVRVVPLTRIVPLAPDRRMLMDFDLFDRVIFVSRNAVRHGVSALADYWPQMPMRPRWYAVGNATATEIRSFGIDPEAPAEASSEGLLALPSLQRLDGERILIVRGVGGLETLARGLESRGAAVSYLEVYERRSAALDETARAQLARPIVLIAYSTATLAALVDNRIPVDGISLVVPSVRVASAAREQGFSEVIIAGDAGETAMLNAIPDAGSW